MRLKKSMFIGLVLCISTMLNLSSFAQSGGLWTWIHGSNTTYQSGVFGTKIIPQPDATPAGKSGAVSWVDNSGNLWMFGGVFEASGTKYSNDLWKYTISTNEWTWISGTNNSDEYGVYGTIQVPSTNNYPGSRSQGCSWVDASGNLWLMGGYGFGASGSVGYLNDVWRYNISTGEWTWMKGASSVNNTGTYGSIGVPASGNTPGSRFATTCWTDNSGNIWILGGYGYASTGSANYNNDLWKYSISNNEWTWVKGANTVNEGATYGTKGTAHSNNKPGARAGGIGILNKLGRPVLIGGQNSSGRLSDVWEYNISTNQWTWVGGDNTANSLANYGTQGASNVNNEMGARAYGIGWPIRNTTQNDLFMFGGYGYNASTIGDLNDIWKYNTGSNAWVWMKGSTSTSQYGTYGTIGVATGTNTPGARNLPAVWTDNSGNYWMWGGIGYGVSSSGYLNDLWKYNQTTNQWTWVKGSQSVNQSATYGTNYPHETGNYPGGKERSSSCQTTNGNFWLFGGAGTDKSGVEGLMNDLWVYYPSENRWTWVSGDDDASAVGAYGTKGTGSVNNYPGGRSSEGMLIADNNSNIWLYGGFGRATTSTTGNLGDLWKYNTLNGEWTWKSGDNTLGAAAVYGTKGTPHADNKPGERKHHSLIYDNNGNIWLFGGENSTGYLNDLWRYNISLDQWTWMSGDNTISQNGSYGNKGTAASGNKPGSRIFQSAWMDNAGNIWIFGGSGYAESTSGKLNDLWKYNISSYQWTWMSGDKTADQAGSYGVKGTSSVTNKPGARSDASNNWVDTDGSLWLFGGSHYSTGMHNDLWRFTPSNSQWTWISGDNTVDHAGVYGTQGTPHANNKPSTRESVAQWYQPNGNKGNLFLWGGLSFYTGSLGYRNDLWRYEIPYSAGEGRMGTFISDKKYVGEKFSNIIYAEQSLVLSFNNADGNTKSELIVSDILGRVLLNTTINHSTDVSQEVTIPLAINVDGVYIIKMKNSDTIFSQKIFIKQ